MKMRLATKQDIPVMREVFDYGRAVQLEMGNTQWEPGYPSRELMLEDIGREAAHVCLNDSDEIVGVISVFTKPDPTYSVIDGNWLNDDPYATIRRLVTNGKEKGTGQFMLKWVLNQYDNVRIDTHDRNEPMKYILPKFEFEYCGVIYFDNGNPGIVYHYEKQGKKREFSMTNTMATKR